MPRHPGTASHHHGAGVSPKEDENWTLLHRESRDGNLQMVKLLVEHGGDVHAKDDHANWTPSHWAANEGADINSDEIWMSLDWVSKERRREVSKFFVVVDSAGVNAREDRRPDVDAQDAVIWMACIA
ncbi:hypothetical protein BC827DRAFT_1156877 [Russula dissimulans]|nr:hypothetical protein BC827DRAFT_1156877 [Russula dissimulans]